MARAWGAGELPTASALMRSLDDVRMRSRRKVERIRVTSLASPGQLILVPLFRTESERELWAFDGVVPAAQEILICPEDWAWVVEYEYG